MALTLEAKKELDEYIDKYSKQKFKFNLIVVTGFLITNISAIAILYNSIVEKAAKTAVIEVQDTVDEIKDSYKFMHDVITEQIKIISNDYGEAKATIGVLSKVSVTNTELVNKISHDIQEMEVKKNICKNKLAVFEQKLSEIEKIDIQLEDNIKQKKHDLSEIEKSLSTLIKNITNLEGDEGRKRIDNLKKLNEYASSNNLITDKIDLIESRLDMINQAPVGTIVAFSGPKENIPKGWVICDGREHSIAKGTTYHYLFKTIGYKWSKNKEGNTFNIPNLNGFFLRGATNNENIGRFENDQIGEHYHTYSQVDIVGSKKDENCIKVDTYERGSADAIYKKMYEINTSVWNPKKETRPKNVSIYWIIKYK